jgi:hypothetical protein
MASNRQLYAEFVDAKVRATITLYDDGAPVTTQTLWDALANPRS